MAPSINNRIAGRKAELAILKEISNAQQAQFLTVYGRRRVGKTHLIREYFRDKGVYLEVIGLKDGSLQEQLAIFHEAMQRTFHGGLPIQAPQSWREAFALLTKELERLEPTKKLILFLDELPWLATRRSGLLQQLDHFWNSYWAQHRNFRLVVCGSAASWILEKLIHAKGGLHNRITHRIALKPFFLHETKEYLKFHKIQMSEAQLAELYMALGGVPFYLNQVKRGRSAAQVIDSTCFSENGLLIDEFPKLVSSLFARADLYTDLLRELTKHRSGVPRKELVERLGMPLNGRSYRRLEELQDSGFVALIPPFGRSDNTICRLYDEFIWFHFNWITRAPKAVFRTHKVNYWLKKIRSAQWNAWSGYAYEMLCFKHTSQIAEALGIDSLNYDTSTWRYVPRAKRKESGAQIDLLFDREDGMISLCEIKYHEKKFSIDRKYAKDLYRKMEVFQERTGTKKELQLVMITKNGLNENAWSQELCVQEVRLSDLFRR